MGPQNACSFKGISDVKSMFVTIPQQKKKENIFAVNRYFSQVSVKPHAHEHFFHDWTIDLSVYMSEQIFFDNVLICKPATAFGQRNSKPRR